MIKIIISFSIMGIESEKVIYIDKDQYWCEYVSESYSSNEPIIEKIDFEKNRVFWYKSKKIEIGQLELNGMWEASPPIKLPDITNLKIEPIEGKSESFLVSYYADDGLLYEQITINKINSLNPDQIKATGLSYLYKDDIFLITDRKRIKKGVIIEYHKASIITLIDEIDQLKLNKFKELFPTH